jgi:hypothetical protein
MSVNESINTSIKQDSSVGKALGYRPKGIGFDPCLDYMGVDNRGLLFIDHD